MNELVTRPPPEVPATPPREPVFSKPLAILIDNAMSPHPDVGLRSVHLPGSCRGEAAAAQLRYEHLIQPAPRQRIMHWLAGVNAGMAKPLPPHELAGRAAEIIEALAGLPAGVFSAVTRREAQMAFQWFPGVKELHDLLAPHARPVFAKLGALRRLLAAPEPAPAPENLTDKERERILAEFRPKYEAAVCAARAAAQTTREERPTPRHLTRDQLIMSYEAQAKVGGVAGRAAETRLEMLRRQDQQ